MTDDHPKVWAVSSGEYSDYSVHCICLSEEDANIVAGKIRALKNDGMAWGQDGEVESFPLINRDIESIDILKLQIEIYDDGSTQSYKEDHEYNLWFLAWQPIVDVQWRWVRPMIQHGIGGRLEVLGTDHERVHRVFSDRKAQLLAEDAFRMKSQAGG